MIRTDFPNRLQPAADLALRPTPPAQEIADRLTGLVVGQRLLAEIQALLPNGSYRAVINQRSVTLALPFAAQTGDAIELEVADTDGKLTLAVVAGSKAAAADGESAATTLSRTAQLIGSLLVDGSRSGRNGSQALPLNENQPLAPSPPRQGQDLLPLLQQAISRSGMFYEAHQAQWVDGRHAKAQLLAEPQGRLSRLPPEAAASEPVAVAEDHAVRTASGALPPLSPGQAREAGNAAPLGQSSTPSPSPVAPQVQAIVQQQLEAFATQVYSWQGQIWPGQDIHWEIESPPERSTAADGDEDARWQTRLLLHLPLLGEVDARLSLVGERLSIAVTAAKPEAIALLRDGSTVLRQHLEQAGVALTAVSFAGRTAAGGDERPAS
ncbi:MAG: Flagellar hook-length control protein FliK [Candidatus Accumulibacter adjunctus]|uniref:Flagellar hook-length control protein FliK n=1 Tax=Candidatus Accumulibacter adjunctus TaxID=1454001 RepID=A0A011NMA5_9PROT|nr:MAG: Flagellar hook-length control protein FliK [Candidatus Accumulibacter adjunctus]